MKKLSQIGQLAFLLSLFFLAGCQTPNEIQIPSTAPQPVELTPYQLLTPTPSIPPEPGPALTSQPQLPSPTPLTHTIQAGDTLSGIALRYNISLDNLVAANPGVSSNLLTIGTTLTIPAGGDEGIFVYPTPTPFPLDIQHTDCLPTATGGIWCLPVAINNQDTTLENLSVIITLFSNNQEPIQSVTSILPLSYLYPGQSLPFQGYLAGPLPEIYQIETRLLTSLPADNPPPKLNVEENTIQYSDDLKTADIEGSVQLSPAVNQDQALWIVAVGYHNQQVVGIRKWISEETLTPGSALSFTLTLYSLGPEIEEIKLYGEIHP